MKDTISKPWISQQDLERLYRLTKNSISLNECVLAAAVPNLLMEIERLHGVIFRARNALIKLKPHHN